MKRFTFIILISFCFFSCDFGTSFEYRITGTVPTAQVSYMHERGWITTPSVVNIPHSIAFFSKQRQQLYINAKNLTASGELTVEIFIDGVLVDSDTSFDPYGIVNASYNH